jgi:hypothetical protein
MYLQHFMLIFQMGSGFSKKRCPYVQDWGQVCRLEAQKLWRFRGIYQSSATGAMLHDLSVNVREKTPAKELEAAW